MKTEEEQLLDLIDAWNRGVIKWRKHNQSIPTAFAELAELIDSRPKPKDCLTASEAVTGFAAWLTTRNVRTTFGSKANCAVIANLVSEFNAANHLTPPRDNYHLSLEFPDEKKWRLQACCYCKQRVDSIGTLYHMGRGTTVCGLHRIELTEPGDVFLSWPKPVRPKEKPRAVVSVALHDDPYLSAPCERFNGYYDSFKVVSEVANSIDGSGHWYAVHLLGSHGEFLRGGWVRELPI